MGLVCYWFFFAKIISLLKTFGEQLTSLICWLLSFKARGCYLNTAAITKAMMMEIIETFIVAEPLQPSSLQVQTYVLYSSKTEL